MFKGGVSISIPFPPYFFLSFFFFFFLSSSCSGDSAQGVLCLCERVVPCRSQLLTKHLLSSTFSLFYSLFFTANNNNNNNNNQTKLVSLFCTLSHSAQHAQHSTVQHSTAQYSTVQHSSAPSSLAFLFFSFSSFLSSLLFPSLFPSSFPFAKT